VARLRFSIRHIMIAIGGTGILLGVLREAMSHDLGPLLDGLLRVVGLFLPVIFIALVGSIVFKISLYPLKIRLWIEAVILFLLLGVSSVIWTPAFYPQEASRCEALSRLASETRSDNADIRAVLDRESAWFSRRAFALRRRGLWLGLTRGPSTRDDPTLSEFVFEMGILEATDRHAKTVERYSSPPP
jgi:hypothetical protein